MTRGPRGFLQRRVLFAESSRADVDWLTGTRVGDEVPQVCLGPVSRLAVESPLCLRNPWAQDRERERRPGDGMARAAFYQTSSCDTHFGEYFSKSSAALSPELAEWVFIGLQCPSPGLRCSGQTRPGPARPGLYVPAWPPSSRPQRVSCCALRFASTTPLLAPGPWAACVVRPGRRGRQTDGQTR